ncbi:MAG: hypothetical protein ABI688_05855 [Bacteroidota bacterium]
MRKLSAILLLSIFTFSQYARQLSYLECKLSNTFKFNSVKCDCEKQAGLDKKDNNQSPSSKTHTHIHLDEFFCFARQVVAGCYYKRISSPSNRLPAADECDGNFSKPWRPPNS